MPLGRSLGKLLPGGTTSIEAQAARRKSAWICAGRTRLASTHLPTWAQRRVPRHAARAFVPLPRTLGSLRVSGARLLKGRFVRPKARPAFGRTRAARQCPTLGRDRARRPPVATRGARRFGAALALCLLSRDRHGFARAIHAVDGRRAPGRQHASTFEQLFEGATLFERRVEQAEDEILEAREPRNALFHGGLNSLSSGRHKARQNGSDVERKGGRLHPSPCASPQPRVRQPWAPPARARPLNARVFEQFRQWPKFTHCECSVVIKIIRPGWANGWGGA